MDNIHKTEETACTNCVCTNLQKSPQREDEYRACLKETGEDILSLFDELEIPEKEQVALLKMARQGFCWQKLKQLLSVILFKKSV